MKKIGIGYENYKEFVDRDMYYVDKTLLIEDIIKKGGKVTLFTRPRRFGKTLALSMLRTFFEKEYDLDGNEIDKRRYFEGMKIMSADEKILSMMGQYPVIKLSLKSAKQPDFNTAFFKIRESIVGEYLRHAYVLESSEIDEDIKENFRALKGGVNDWEKKKKELKNPDEEEKALRDEIGRYATSLMTLSDILKRYYGKNAIILLDEYDVPLENAYYQGFYEEMVGFIRSLFESALKTNDALEFAVVTGCLRISKESIFTGLNNLEVNSIRGDAFDEYFGFTEEETCNILAAYNLLRHVDTVKEWYDGYVFGQTKVYNPWSVIKYTKDHVLQTDRFPEPYWSNTSSNSIIKDMIEKADNSVGEELDRLISGGTIEKKIHEDITYDDIDKSEDNLWNFLFFTGYMKKVSERQENEDIYVTMTIPNAEIRSVYRNQISDWFDRKVKEEIKKDSISELYTAIANKDADKMGDFVSNILSKSISYFDSAESFYHGFFLSLLYGMPGYTAKSNRESGDGRADIVLYPDRPKDPAYIFELKVRKKFNEMDDGIDEALEQIKTQKYEEGILDEGYAGVISFGVCFCKKSCMVGYVHCKSQ